MSFSKLLGARLGNPTGLFGRFAAILWNRRNAALNDTALEALDLQPADRVLEIGFGGGYLLDRMLSIIMEGRLAGVDVSPAMIAYVEGKHAKAMSAGKLALRCAPAESLPYPDVHFTKVCSVNSLFYWHNVELGFKEIGRVLVNEGNMVLCFTCKSSLEKRSFAPAIRLFEAEEVEHILAIYGFQDIEVSYYSDKHRRYACMTATIAKDGVQAHV